MSKCSTYTSVEDSSDSASMIDSLVRISQDVQENLELDDDNKVLIGKRLLAQVINDHFRFYDILHRYTYIVVYHHHKYYYCVSSSQLSSS